MLANKERIIRYTNITELIFSFFMVFISFQSDIYIEKVMIFYYF